MQMPLVSDFKVPTADSEKGFVVKSAILETVCGSKSKIPESEFPEYAFVGRSNVGKSSLINALMGRKSLARVSAQPGKTRTINFYKINGEFFLVDLPGYGYAKASPAARVAWGKLAERYLFRKKKPERFFLLVDSRIKPGNYDILMYNWIVSQGLQPVIIANKADKLGKNAKVKSIKLIREALGDYSGPVILFSAVQKIGLELIYDFLKPLTG